MFPTLFPNKVSTNLLVGQVTVGSTVASITFNGLDGQRDGCYNLEGTIVSGGGGVTKLTTNNDDSAYTGSMWETYNANKASYAQSSPTIGKSFHDVAPYTNAYNVEIVYCNGYVTYFAQNTCSYTTALILNVVFEKKTNKIQNLTSLTIATTGGFIVGTKLSLYRHG